MFIEITMRLSQAPERHMADVAPELGKLLHNVFYKHYAPLALQNLRIRQQHQNCTRTTLIRSERACQFSCQIGGGYFFTSARILA